MEIKDWATAPTQSKLYQELATLGLLENVSELDEFGFTVVPPEKVGSPELHQALHAALTNVIEGRFGSLSEDGWKDKSQIVRLILWDDPIFEQLVLNPAGLGLIQYLIGTNCILALCDGWVKGPGGPPTPLHIDNYDSTRRAHPPEPHTATFHYLLSDYSAEGGGLGFVPGSHKWRRAPTPAEVANANAIIHVPDAPAGSILVWGDLTWHASTSRTLIGERLAIMAHYCRPYMQTQEPFRATVTNEALARNPKRFATLMDVYGPFPYGKNDMDLTWVYRASQYDSLFDREPAGEAVSTPLVGDYLAFDLNELKRNQAKGREAREIFENAGKLT